MYRVEVADKARRRIARLPSKHRRQLLGHITILGDDPRPPGSVKLEVMEGYRVTSGEYRVLYTVDDAQHLVRVYLVFQRGEGYPG